MLWLVTLRENRPGAKQRQEGGGLGVVLSMARSQRVDRGLMGNSAGQARDGTQGRVILPANLIRVNEAARGTASSISLSVSCSPLRHRPPSDT